MRKLAERLYKNIEKGLKVKCPHKGCLGLVIKVTGEKFEQYTEVYWENTNYYRCNRNCKHVWRYLRNSIDEAIDSLKKPKP